MTGVPSGSLDTRITAALWKLHPSHPPSLDFYRRLCPCARLSHQDQPRRPHFEARRPHFEPVEGRGDVGEGRRNFGTCRVSRSGTGWASTSELSGFAHPPRNRCAGKYGLAIARPVRESPASPAPRALKACTCSLRISCTNDASSTALASAQADHGTARMARLRSVPRPNAVHDFDGACANSDSCMSACITARYARVGQVNATPRVGLQNPQTRPNEPRSRILCILCLPTQGSLSSVVGPADHVIRSELCRR